MLAHELAHVWCGHATRQRRISAMPFFTAIAIWLATLIWLQLDQPPERVPDIVIVTLALCVLVMGMAASTAPSRAHEWEADRAAVDLFGIGLDDELAAWMQVNGFGDGRTPEFIHTHPKAAETSRNDRHPPTAGTAPHEHHHAVAALPRSSAGTGCWSHSDVFVDGVPLRNAAPGDK
jgi:Zn-dependent protease with chaperone function